MPVRGLVSAQNTIDQSRYAGSSNIGFGTFASVRYRGQVFIPTQSVLSTFGFWLIDPTQGKDMDIFLTDVDQALLTPISSVLAQWTIPTANLQRQFTMYPLVAPYTFSTLGGHKYGIYLGPSTSGAYANAYRGCMFLNSSGYAGGIEITNTNGVWSTENLTLNFATGTPASRSHT